VPASPSLKTACSPWLAQNLFPHGIDVIRKTDFFAVSMRRSSFLECAPQVAV
jgi:hypothetical protein